MTELVMNSSDVTVKVLAGTPVYCQQDGCEKPAVYLFSSDTTKPFYAAHCSEHAREIAKRLLIKVPSIKITRTQRWLESERIARLRVALNENMFSIALPCATRHTPLFLLRDPMVLQSLYQSERQTERFDFLPLGLAE